MGAARPRRELRRASARRPHIPGAEDSRHRRGGAGGASDPAGDALGCDRAGAEGGQGPRGQAPPRCHQPAGDRAAGHGLAVGHTSSGGEQVAAWAKGAAVFKTLNTTGFGNMENSGGYAQKPVMFFAGDDSAKRATVAALLADLGSGPGRCRAAAQCATLGALRDAVDRSRDEARPGPRHRLRADEARPAGLKKCACRHI
jgi:hypothetical protein